MSLSDEIRKRPLIAYFLLAYGLSWGGVVAVVGLYGSNGAVAPGESLFLTVVVVQFTGPFLAGVVLGVVLDGRASLQRLWRRQRRTRVGVEWYVVALGTTPVLLAIILGGLSVVSPAFLPGIVTTDDRMMLVAIAIGGGLLVAFFEEIGWTGFALPQLRTRYSLLTGGVCSGAPGTDWRISGEMQLRTAVSGLFASRCGSSPSRRIGW